ncbi:CAP domain-containing protein [Streptomyces sp. NPDC126503]|uniref:CAP domain-containing protein n=1 Tax=Streptomyces sp. NPDC126503 TaxID=3155315 RepID=UPI003319E768
MRYHEHPGHPEALDPQEGGPAPASGRHRRGGGGRRRAPRRPAARTAVTLAGTAAAVFTVATAVYVAAPAPAADPVQPPLAAPAPPSAATALAAVAPASAPVTAPAPASTPAAPSAPRSPAVSRPPAAPAPSTSSPAAAPRTPAAATPSPARPEPAAPASSPARPSEAAAETGGSDAADRAGGGAAQYAQHVIALVNAERQKAGCGPLRAEKRLRLAAQRHADDMAARDYYAHDTPEGRDAGDRITAVGYPWSAWAENIHRGPKTPARAMEDWMESPGHRENILNCSFDEIGVGVSLASNGPWWVQNFGSRR